MVPSVECFFPDLRQYYTVIVSMRARLVGDIRKVVELPSVQCASRLVTTQGPAGITLDTTARIPELVGSNQVMVRVLDIFFYFTVLHCTLLYCTVLYCNVLYCTVSLTR